MDTVLLIVVLQATQFNLIDREDNIIGHFSYTENTAWLTVNGFQTDTFVLKLEEKRLNTTTLYVENEECTGTITIKISSIEFDFVIENKYHLLFEFMKSP